MEQSVTQTSFSGRSNNTLAREKHGGYAYEVQQNYTISFQYDLDNLCEVWLVDG